MFIYKNFFINIILLKIIIYSNCITFKKINQSFTNITWNNNEQYLYYIDIKDYYIEEENVIEFIIGFINEIKDTKIYIHTTNLTEKDIINKNININNFKEDPNKNSNIKKRASSNLFFYANVFKKTKKDQTFHLILIEPKNIKNGKYAEINLSNRIKNFTFTKNNFINNSTIVHKLQVKKDVEHFYKFIIEDISVEKQNILFFIKEFNIANYYGEKLLIQKFRDNRLYIIEKKSTNKTSHIVYLSLIGEVGEINMEITLIKNDIIGIYNHAGNFYPFYIENMKYKEDLYIIENYNKYSNLINTDFFLNIIPLYGNYTLTYYNSYNTTDFKNLFIYSNGTIINKKVNQVSGISNFYRLSCSSPCALKFGYIKARNISNILTEGGSKTKYIKCDYFNREWFHIEIDDRNKEYVCFFELILEDDVSDKSYILMGFTTTGESRAYRLYRDKKKEKQYLYYNFRNPEYKSFFHVSSDDGAFLKFYLTSNSLYTNIIEGLNIIDISSSKFAFKMKKDILYDYVMINIYSHDRNNNISIFYDVKILSPDKIDNGKILCELPTSGEINKKEIILKYSNPYNKFNSKIKDDELMYIVFNVTNTKYVFIFPIYVNIKYYYNNSIINLPHNKPKILNKDNEYKIFGDKKYKNKNNLILNINKCNLYKNYSIHTYYENTNNIIWKDYILQKRNIIFYNNLINYKNIQLKEIINNTNFSNLKSFSHSNYLTNGDIYMNYFTINESLFNNQTLTNDFYIKYKDDYNKINLIWSPYIKEINNISELITQYSIYIFPENTKINSICQMSLIPPNYTIFNKTNYNIELSQGKYKVNIIASIINDQFPMTTLYDTLDLDVSSRLSTKLMIILLISLGILFIFIIIYCYIRRKDKYKNRRTIDRKFPYYRDSFWISMTETKENKDKKRTKSKESIKNKQILYEKDDDDEKEELFEW